MAELVLQGCTATPLSAYLKGLAVLRLVARQADADARARWDGDVLVLTGTLGADELVAFFLDRYRPSPVVSPWNGGSGFHLKDARVALDRIEGSDDDRLAAYRQTIAAARQALVAAGGKAGTAQDAKAALASRCRATFPDVALEWLDAALVLTAGGLEFPRLLGSGGNDGRLDFSNNHMQRLCDVLPELGADRAGSAGWLRSALFGDPPPPLREAAVGMYNPGAAGGANATAGFEGVSLVNPWDFVLTIEGSLLFAGAAARRLGPGGETSRAAFPFTVQPSTAGVTAGASEREQVRAEVWLPLWTRPASLAEVENLCGEGRAEWRGRQARDAVEFAQAVAALGVARGIDDFARYAIYQRMGRSHVATQVGRIRVEARPEADLLAGIDWWLRRFRDRVGQDAPAALRERRQRLEQAIFQLCQHGGAAATRDVLIELGRAEMAAAMREVAGVPPLDLGRASDWLLGADDGSPEHRLAAALGSLGAGTSLPLRANLEPVTHERGHLVRRSSRSEVWTPGAAGASLASVFRRRLLDAEMAGDQRLALTAARSASLTDVARLFARATADGVDLDRVGDLAVACAMLRWPPVPYEPTGGRVVPAALPPLLPRAYALLKLCCLPFPVPTENGEVAVPIEPAIFAALAAGRTADAVHRAASRLRGSGIRLHRAAWSAELAAALDAGRLEAALLVPIPPGAAGALAASVSIAHESEVPA
jgi:CRISPR-associated protein Csx17